MTDLLQVKPSDRVLEIGTGSGYQAAVLSLLAREVYSIEIVAELGKPAALTLSRLGYANIETRIGDGYQGWEEHAPYDAIIVTAAPNHVPPALIAQLKPGGRPIVPVGEISQELILVVKATAFRPRSRRQGAKAQPQANADTEQFTIGDDEGCNETTHHPSSS